MFESTLNAHATDLQRTTRLSISACASLALLMLIGGGVWSADHLKISKVRGPKVDVLDISALTILAPPKVNTPPPPVEHESGGGGVDNAQVPVDDLKDNLEEEIPSSITQPTNSDGSESPGKTPGVPGVPCIGGVCGAGIVGVGEGGGGCVGPNCGSGGGELKTTKAPPPLDVEISKLSCISCPDPTAAELRKSSASMRKARGHNVTKFCVDERGKVDPRSLRTVDGFGDATVDQVVRKTVSRWRLRPFEVDGRPRRACTRASFDIRFE